MLTASTHGRGKGTRNERPKMKTTLPDSYNWEYELENGGVTITGVSPKPKGSVAIPAALDGWPVTRIGGRAFECCDDLQDTCDEP